MKTSNKLLFSFLGFAWVSVVGSMFVSLYFSEKENAMRIETLIHQTPIEGGFSVVSIQDSGILTFKRGGESRVEYKKYLSESDVQDPSEDPDPYFTEVRNDTLFIKELRIKELGTFTLCIDKDIKSIILNNVSELRSFDAINYDSLTVMATKSAFRLDNQHGVSFLNFNGNTDSRLSVVSIPNLEIYLDKSNAGISQYLGTVSGELIGSEVNLPSKTTEINIKKDENSRFYFRN
ncbi:hypothetical protein MM236_16830 [Belliella sp. DSM 107340]|uniref:Auto-transporter adhesin head GIN domain-containing protein n=1 Tax=Belliella calami TaxID=2923436 RepID=A0ABS9USR9_9BACT|nr:hypothetical protein [Belliella calami]MCH7399665.1 hypothetical protein [Belliella calami]